MSLDRIKGTLLGVHSGDALGARVEFMTRSQVRAFFPDGVTEIEGGGTFAWRRGQPTDDTDLTIYLAQSYAETGGADEQGLMRLNAQKMQAWMESGPRDIGDTTVRALERFLYSQDPHTSGQKSEDSISNGSLMRISPVGCVRKLDDPRLMREADLLGAITHAHPVCREACKLYAYLISGLVEGFDSDLLLNEITRFSQTEDVRIAIHNARTIQDADDLPPPYGGYALHAFQVALWALAQNLSFREGVEMAAWLGEDTDTLGAITGGLLGARDGITAIPDSWLETLEARDILEDLAEDLFLLRVVMKK